MNRLMTYALTTSVLLGVGTHYAEGRSVNRPDLEPCMNGEVSASGTFPTQAAEDRYYSAAPKQGPRPSKEVRADRVEGDEVTATAPRIGD